MNPSNTEPSSYRDYAKAVASLKSADRLSFYEQLAHSLTICFRVVAHEDALSTEEKLVALSHLNELQHQLVSKIRSERLERPASDDDMLFMMMSERIRTCPPLAGEVGWAIKSSYEYASTPQGE